MKLVNLIFLFLIFYSNAWAIEPGEIAPDLESTSNIRLQLEDYKDTIIYLDFWASWCGSCQISLPWMNELSTKYSDKKFRIIAVALDKDKSNAEILLSEINPKFEVQFDPEGKLASLFKIPTMPSSYLIGADRKIIKAYKGFSDKHKVEIEEDIRKMMEFKDVKDS